MNGKKAKFLRKKIYGDMSLKVERKYFLDNNCVIRNIGLRSEYQKAKKKILKNF